MSFTGTNETYSSIDYFAGQLALERFPMEMAYVYTHL